MAVIDHAFNYLGVDELVTNTSPVNLRSKKLMERLGFERSENEDFDHPNVPVGHPLQRMMLYRKRK